MCLVVKILLSGGIRGAEAQKAWPLDFLQNSPAPQPSMLPQAQAGWQTVLSTALPWAL